MTADGKTRADADGGWKDIIEDFTEEFFEFYFPDVHAAVDFTQPVEFLDTELRKISPASKGSGHRRADRLIKVVLRTGEEQWLYIHVEVQGETHEAEQEFAERMYVYNYRIFDTYGKNVVSLAVLTDDNAAFRPHEYRREFKGNSVVFTFLSTKLMDMDLDALASSSRIFALVTRIQLEYNRVRRDDEKRHSRKLALTRELYRKGYSRERIIRLFRFLDFLMRLPPPLAIQYRQELEAIEGDLDMPYVTSVERLAKNEGVTEGQLQRAREYVIEALEVRFTVIPYQLGEAINHINSDRKLKELHRLAITVESLDEFSV